MKKNHLLIVCILLIVCAATSSCKKNNEVINSECNTFKAPADTYQYPILPGTHQWVNLQTTEARWAACQVPQNLLTTMSTEGVVESWLTMPLRNEIFVTNSVQKAMEWFIQNFSGLNELMKRNDAAEKLLFRYQSLAPSCVKYQTSEDEKGEFTSKFIYAGIPLAQDVILDQMDMEQRKKLVAEALKKMDEELKYYDVFGYPSIVNCCFICAKVMKNSDYTPFLSQLNIELTYFIEHGQFYIPINPNTEEVNIILSSAKMFIQ